MHLELQVFDLVLYLIRNRERVVSKEELLEAVWRGRIVSDSAFSTRINAARQAIGDSGEQQQFIQTLARRGFRFVADVEEQPDQLATRLASEAAQVRTASSERPSIAVMPFDNPGGAPDEGYFAEGMAEALITSLSQIRWLTVSARSSSFAFKGRDLDAHRIGNELNVRYLLEGSVRRVQDRVRISAQLIDAEASQNLWGDKSDGLLEDVFDLQDRITANVIGAIEPSLRGAEIARAERKRPENLGAYDLYLRALSHAYDYSREGRGLALELLDKALAMDPDYAEAHGQRPLPSKRGKRAQTCFQFHKLSLYECACYVFFSSYYRRYSDAVRSLPETNGVIMPSFLCSACGTQYPPSEAPPGRCRICTDERQFVPAAGQSWTTLEGLRKGHSNKFRRLAVGLTTIETTPAFGIAQRAILARTPAGNVLWDCLALIDDATVDLLKGLGGVAAIAISHPHYYTTMVEWSRALGGVPIHLHAADCQWVMRADPAVQFWEGDTKTIAPGLTLVRLGGHFDGGTVLHWADWSDGRGVLLSGDILQVVPSGHVSFMWSYPNLIPLSAAKVQRMAEILQPFAFDAVYGAFSGRGQIDANGKQVVAASVARYIARISEK